ncbi:MAG: polysaccharide deacetylase family protein [Clostridiales bacterium]|nr:polysaccharide deacetylase family protein [Clostridiales bacterium]
MNIKKYIIIVVVIFFFSLGFTLGLKQQLNKEYISPEEKQLEKNYQLQVRNDFMNSKNVYDSKTNSTNSPDQEYYEKAVKLHNQYPDTFIMKHQIHDKRIALTFDDGPDAKTTIKILDILKQYNIPATFFVLGENVKSYPAVVKRMIAEGHQVANHSWSHLRPTDLSLEDFIAEIEPAEKILQNYNSSSEPLYYRPPYGLVTPTQIEAMKEKGYKIISWSIDSLDWTEETEPEKIRDKVISSAHPGAIVLMHCAGGNNNRIDTAIALPDIIESLKRQGYEFATVHDLINDK